MRQAHLSMLLALTLVLLDQGSKWVASTELNYLVPVQVWPWFNWNLAHNEGAAWSFLANAGGWQRYLLATLSAVVSVVLAVWIYRLKPFELVLRLPLTLVLAGAVGNLIDRVRLGYVVDFIQLHYQDWYFPTFNVADICISVGAALLLLLSLFTGKEPSA